jgi:hypothetical protein
MASWVGGRGGVVGRGSGRRRGFGTASWVRAFTAEVAFPCGPTSRGGTPVRFQTPKPHKAATSRAEHPRKRTKLPPRPTTPPSRARSGTPVRPHFTKWHSRAISDPKTARHCHLAGGAPPKTHETATSTDNPAIPGTKWHSRAARLHEVALLCDFRPQNRTKLPPRGRGTPETARNCHLDPKTDDAGAPFGSVGWRLPDTEEFSVVRWWLSPHLLEVNGSGSGNRHPVQGGAGRGNQPRPRATTEAPRRHRCPGPPPKPRRLSRFPRCSAETLPARSATQPPTAHPHRTGPTPRHEPEVEPGAPPPNPAHPPPNPARRPHPERNGKAT